MLITVTGPDNPSTVKDLADAALHTDKPMVVSLFDIAGLVEPQVKLLQEKHVPVYPGPETGGECPGQDGRICRIQK